MDWTPVYNDPDALRAQLDGFAPTPSLFLVDFDGVVVDSEAIQHRSYSAALAPYHIDVSIDDFRRYIGSSEDQILERIEHDCACTLELGAVKAHRAVLLDAEFATLPGPNWFVPPALEWIARHQGTAQIVSAGHRHRITATLDRFRLAPLIDAIHTVPEQPPGTTKTDLLNELITRPPASTVIIEDNVAILAYAARRGCRTVGVENAYNTGLDFAADVTVSPASTD
jgi:beta-phosphoglucomutase-like phosphatase (HAD superfamily)